MQLTQEHLDRLPFCEGRIDAPVAFVGEAPGNQEALDPERRPFIGGSGQELRRMCQQAGIEQYYMTNVLKEHPPDNKWEPFVKENPKLLEAHIKLLAKELAACKANVIVPCGGKALEAVCQLQGITKWRGSILPAKLEHIVGRKCVPIIHPAAILRKWTYRPATFCDLQRVAEESKTPLICLPEEAHTFIHSPTFEEACTRLHQILAHDGPVSVDTETRRGVLESIQFSCNLDWSICIPLRNFDNSLYWSLEEEVELFKLIAQVLYTQRLIGANFLTYDIFVLHWHGFDWRKIHANMWVDTQECFQTGEPEQPKSLAFLISIYTRWGYHKDDGKERTTKLGDREFRLYGCKDVAVTDEIAPQEHQELRSITIPQNVLTPAARELLPPGSTLWDFYKYRFRWMGRRRMEMSLRGIKVDEAKREELRTKYQRETIKAQCQLNLLTDRCLNVKSHKQMVKLLYEDMKLPKKKRKGGGITANEDALLELSAEHPSEVFELIIKVRQLRTLLSNFIEVQTDSDGRVRSSYGFTETGRFTSSKNPFYTGFNLQNWPRIPRAMLRSDDDDHLLLEMDLSQVEARIVAWRSRDEEGIKDFLTGVDKHKKTACVIFDLIEKHGSLQGALDHLATLSKEQQFLHRYTGKRVNHAANYGMQAGRFAQVYNGDANDNNVPFINIQQAQDYLDRFSRANPKLESVYQREIRREVSRTKTLWNIWGRRMRFHDRLGPELFKSAYAWYAQSINADLTNLIFDRVAGSFESMRWSHDAPAVVNQCHDSLVVHLHKDDLDAVVEIMYKCSRIPMVIEGRELVVPVEFKVGLNWYDMKEVPVPIEEAA